MVTDIKTWCPGEQTAQNILEALKNNAESSKGLCPFEPWVKMGTPPLKFKIAHGVCFSGEGVLKNNGFV